VRRVMGGVVLGAVGVVALQALLIIGYLAVGRQDPIVLNPDRHALEDEGVSMVMFCGKGGGGVLTKVSPNGGSGPWTRGGTVRGDCQVWWHHDVWYVPCVPGYGEHTTVNGYTCRGT